VDALDLFQVVHPPSPTFFKKLKRNCRFRDPVFDLEVEHWLVVRTVRTSNAKPEKEKLTKVMQPTIENTSKGKLWTGRILSGLSIAFLLFDAAMKLVKAQPVIEGTVQLGYPESTIIGMGLVLLLSTLLYAIPRTAFLGAILLTGYLGGAVATHVRVGNPLFSHVLFPVYVGIMIWGGLYLRDRRIRAFFSSND
jgi:hypothetical protein